MPEDELPPPIDGDPWADPWHVTPFAYHKPDVAPGGKVFETFARTPLLYAGVQVLNGGGDNILHSHPHTDEAWFVLSGRVRFYTANDEVVGDLSANEGLLIPKGFPYWFATAENEEAELLRFAAAGPGVPTDGHRDVVRFAPDTRE